MDPMLDRLFLTLRNEAGGDGDGGGGAPAGDGGDPGKGDGGDGGAPAGGAPTTYTRADLKALSPLEFIETPEIRDDPTIRNTKSIESMAQQLISAQKMVGNPKNYLKRLGPDATPEERQAFFRELGAPEKPDEYTLPEGIERPENMPEMSEKRVGEFRELFHQLGLTKEQGQALLGAYSGMEASVWQEVAQQAEERFAQAESQLKSDWGQAYDEKLQLAQRAANAKGDEFKAWLESKGLDNDPHMIRMLAEVGGNMQDPGLPDGPSGRRSTGALTPEAAQQQIQELYADAEFMKAYSGEKGVPQATHDAAVAKMQRLFQTAYPAKERSQ